MATFHVRQKSHPPVLPQQLALEFESADIPRIGDETGLERRKAPGVEHVRGETSGSSPAAAKPKGWLAPSLRHRVETTMSWTNRLARWAPVRAVHVERVAFDTHAISAGKPLEGAEYQHGTLHGTEVRECLLAKWGRACAYCGTTGVPLNIDHIHPRSRGGSDRISNLCTACIPCNQAKDNRPVEEFLSKSPRQLARILAQAKGKQAPTPAGSPYAPPAASTSKLPTA